MLGELLTNKVIFVLFKPPPEGLNALGDLDPVVDRNLENFHVRVVVFEPPSKLVHGLFLDA